MESIQEFLRILNRMELSDFVDIIVVAFLIYKMLPLIRTPSMMRIVRTVAALVLVKHNSVLHTHQVFLTRSSVRGCLGGSQVSFWLL